MRKIAAMVIMIVMILPVLCVLSVNDTKAENVKAEVGSGGFVPVTLYFHNESVLDTNAPVANNSTTTNLENGKSVVFDTDSLDKELSVNNSYSFRVAFNFTVNVTRGNCVSPYLDYVRVNLTIAVLGDSTECATAKYSGEKVYASTSPVSCPFNVSTTLCFTDGWDFKFDEDDKIKVKITPEIEEHDVGGIVTDIPLSYTAYMEYDYEDKLGVLSNVHCAPVEIVLDTYDKNNQPKTNFMPNLAAEYCIIRFRGGIENAFGDEDITYVSIEVNGPNVHTPAENITGNKTKELLYEWDYSKYSTKFVADIPYTATLTVETVQHTFTQTTNFTFKAYGLEAKIDNEVSASETICVGEQADYTVSIRNTGSYDKSDTVNVRLDIELSPYKLHSWNIIFGSESVNVSGYGTYLTCEILNFYGGAKKEFPLTAKSLNATGEISDDWYCRIDITVKFVHHSEIPSILLLSKTYLAPPYKIDIDWAETYNDPCYILVNVSYSLYINVTNMGSMPDTVNLTLNYTNHDVWDVSLETEIVDLERYHHNSDYYDKIKLNVIASLDPDEDVVVNTVVNITAYSKGFWEGRNETLTHKYLTLNLSRAFGIKPLSIVAKGPEAVDVKNSTGQVTYEVSIETNDNTIHTVDLTAVCDNENIDVSFDDDSVEVRKDSPKIVTMTVTCAKGMLAGSYTITVNASIRGAPVSGHNKTANVIVTVNEYYALSVVWVDSNKNNITVTAAPGEYFYRTLRVTNKGNSNISVSIDPVNVHDFQLFDSAVPSQFSLSYGEEKNVTIYLYIPKDAKDGDTFVVHMETSGAGSPKSAVITIEIKQDWVHRLMDVLYSMIYFIILLIAVVIVFITVWVKKKKMR